jgi:hypothetical protein
MAKLEVPFYLCWTIRTDEAVFFIGFLQQSGTVDLVFREAVMLGDPELVISGRSDKDVRGLTTCKSDYRGRTGRFGELCGYERKSR